MGDTILRGREKKIQYLTNLVIEKLQTFLHNSHRNGRDRPILRTKNALCFWFLFSNNFIYELKSAGKDLPHHGNCKGWLPAAPCLWHSFFAIKRSHLNQLSTGGDENTIVNQVLQGHTSNSNCKRTPLVPSFPYSWMSSFSKLRAHHLGSPYMIAVS